MPGAMLTRGVVGLAMILATSCLAGCGEGGGKILHSGNTIVLVDEDHSGDATVGVGYGGTVAMVGHCVGIGAATVVWPYGTTVVSDAPLTLDVPGLGHVRLGAQVSGGGGDYGSHLPRGIGSIPSGCPTEQIVAFHPGG